MLGIPSILIPLPGALDHQTKNAESLADGRAVIIPDENCTGVRIAKEIKGIVLDEERLLNMGMPRHPKSENAAEKIATLLIEVAK